MSDPSGNQPIRAKMLAEKLASVRNFEHEDVLDQITAEPRLVEALWFLQWVSRPENYAGGLRKFAVEFSEASKDLIGPLALREAGNVPFSEETVRAILKSVPVAGGAWSDIPRGLFDDDLEDWLNSEPAHLYRMARAVRFDCEDDAERFHAERERPARLTGKLRRDALAMLDREFFARQCLDIARENLPEYFRAVCEQARVGLAPKVRHDSSAAPWYFAEIGKALIRFLDQWKAREQERIAETVIKQQIFKWIGKGLATRLPVAIEGNSRFGKSESIRTFAAMHPGSVRLVETPPSAGVGDLIRDVARALGVEVPARQQGHLRETVEYVLAHSGLGLIFDEAQFLLPSNFTRHTAPARLNWVRRAVIDRGVSAAFIQTPQSYHSAKKRFVSATSYAMEQWDERMLKTLKLPEEIGEEDLLAIARIHFSGLPEKSLRYVVNACVATHRNYVSDVAKIAAFAKEAARDAGREAIKIEDVLATIADVLPPAPQVTLPGVHGAKESLVPRSCTHRTEQPLHTPCKVRARSVQPVGMASEMEPTLRINFGSENSAGLIPASGG